MSEEKMRIDLDRLENSARNSLPAPIEIRHGYEVWPSHVREAHLALIARVRALEVECERLRGLYVRSGGSNG